MINSRPGGSKLRHSAYDACYMGDDLFPHYFDDDPANAQPEVEVYDPWTVLPLMAELTQRMRIGSLVTPCGRRHPGLFAKMTSIVDIVSQGQADGRHGCG